MNPAAAERPRSEPLLQIDGLDCARGGRLVLRDVSFAIAAGELIVVIGPNGSGKTSLLRCIAGLLEPSAGTIAGSARSKGKTLHVGHADPAKPHLTVLENLRFWSALGGDGGATAQDAASAFGLTALLALPARILSAGQRRRLSLARLLLTPSELWLLDEPANALDRDGVERLAAAVAAHRAQGGSAIVATHDLLPFAQARQLALRSGTVAC